MPKYVGTVYLERSKEYTVEADSTAEANSRLRQVAAEDNPTEEVVDVELYKVKE